MWLLCSFCPCFKNILTLNTFYIYFRYVNPLDKHNEKLWRKGSNVSLGFKNVLKIMIGIIYLISQSYRKYNRQVIFTLWLFDSLTNNPFRHSRIGLRQLCAGIKSTNDPSKLSEERVLRLSSCSIMKTFVFRILSLLYILVLNPIPFFSDAMQFFFNLLLNTLCSRF